MNPDGTNMSYGICSADEARLIGVKLFMQYGGKPNDPNSFIDALGVSKIFADVYNIIEQPFKAGPGEIESMGRVLDQNSDGRISLQDFQALCVKYLAADESTTIRVVNPLTQSVIVEQIIQQQPVQQVVVQQVVHQQQQQQFTGPQTTPRFTWAKAPNYQITTQLAQIYDQSDNNRDGFLSQDEIRRLITATYQLTFGEPFVPSQDEVYQFISANDQFGDGRIIKDEFIRQTTYELLKMKGQI